MVTDHKRCQGNQRLRSHHRPEDQKKGRFTASSFSQIIAETGSAGNTEKYDVWQMGKSVLSENLILREEKKKKKEERKQDMTLQQIYYVITVSETGSLNKASELLYLSQPSLTSAIKELEKELGIIIFHRSGRGVSLTNDGLEFISYARQLYQQYDRVMEKYGKRGNLKKKFGISTQHYSFAVKSFVELAKKFDMEKYEFAFRETKTREVIEDVSTLRSEIGILYLSDFNRNVIMKLLHTNQLEFHRLIDCDAYVYLWKGHPLAGNTSISFYELMEYPCLAFEQGDSSSFYLSEEILSNNEYSKMIKVNDRATMLNLMIGLNGYTLCSGIICEELNGTDFITVPFNSDEDNPNSKMELGYIVKKNMIPSEVGSLYIRELKQCLRIPLSDEEGQPLPDSRQDR